MYEDNFGPCYWCRGKKPKLVHARRSRAFKNKSNFSWKRETKQSFNHLSSAAAATQWPGSLEMFFRWEGLCACYWARPVEMKPLMDSSRSFAKNHRETLYIPIHNLLLKNKRTTRLYESSNKAFLYIDYIIFILKQLPICLLRLYSIRESSF